MVIPSVSFADDYPSDSCANPRSIQLNGTASGHLVGNGSSPFEEDFFVFTVPSNGELHIWSTGYNDDLDAFLYNDDTCSNEVARDTRGAGQTHNVDFTYQASGGTTYKLKIRGWSGDADYVLHVDFTPSGTIWVKNAAGDSAYTDPSPYTNNSDATETLSISGATMLEVHISGETEDEANCNYDYVEITDGNGDTRRFCGNIDETYLAAGPNVDLLFHSDGGVVASGVSVSIAIPQARAESDSYETPINTTLNIDAADGVLSNDGGEGIRITDHTDPSDGLLNLNEDGSFTYTPPNNFTGTVTFSYTITDEDNNTDSADVTIVVAPQYSSGQYHPFYLVNPPKTRNTIGNYKIAGNTVLCLTDHTSTYGGTCQGNNPSYDIITSNMHISKYLDIDEDPSTWDSTSSYIEIPDSFIDKGTILWAGLFWQGRLSMDHNYPIRYAKENGSGGYDLIEIGSGSNSNIDDYDSPEEMAAAGANQIKLKIDNGNYHKILASALHTYTSSNGTTYDAFADVTSIVNNEINSSGKHVFTVANLMTMEGREPSPGAYGGWALVVIYAEDYGRGHARNISIYNGFISISSNDDPIPISGFRLPSTGDVDAAISVFSGEGEYRYGYRPGSNSVDWMKISDHENSGYDYMPGVPAGRQRPNRNNMFDAILAGISRDHIIKNGQDTFNDQSVNNVGVDVDNYDVSELMTQYREDNPDIDTVYIRTYSNNDYITPGMLAFSAQLYQPKVCYDFAVKRNEFLIPSHSTGRGGDYNTTAQINDEISFTVAIRSMEGDMDLSKVSVALTLDQEDGNISYIRNPDKAYYSRVNSNTLLPTDYSSLSDDERPVISIGKGRTDDVGGLVSPHERYFSKFYYRVNDLNQSRISGRFNIEVNASMDFGSGEFWQIMQIDRCEQNLTYNPQWYRFNVEKPFTGSIPSNDTDHYSLPTRISGRDFNYSVASYIKNPLDNYRYTEPAPADGITVDVEMINIDAFDDNGSYFKCSNPDPDIIVMPGRFVYFDNGDKRKLILDSNDLSNTYAIRSATFRMWLLIDENGTILSDASYHSKNDNAYFATVYDNYFKDRDSSGLCSNACSAPYSYTSPRASNEPSAVGCYACLRDYFAQPYCARDNFAIRPKAIRVKVNDKGPDANLTALIVGENNDTTVDFAAGYPYEMQLTAVRDDGSLALRYYTDVYKEHNPLASVPSRVNGSLALHEFTSTGVCQDESNRSLGLVFHNSLATTELKQSNAGSYRFEIWDSNWTVVDRADRNPYKTLFDPNCNLSSSAACNDCVLGGTDDTENGSGKVGCSFGSKIDNGNTEYTDLNITYHPYKFDLSNLGIHTRPHDGVDWLYDSNLSKSKSMAVTLEGNLTARGADDTILSNYTAQCVAQDIAVHMDTNTTPDPVVDENNATVVLQQVLYQYDNSSPSAPVYSSVQGAESNMTLSKWNFRSGDLNGSATVHLLFNLEKPYDTPINVVDINFTTAYAYGINDLCYADQNSSYRPDGNVTADQRRWFYYARVAPAIGTDGRQIYTPDTTTTTTLHVNVFCINGPGINCPSLTGLSSAAEEGDWYRMEDHLSSNNDGNITELNTTVAGVVINGGSNRALNLTFDNNGSTSPITIYYPLTPRPVHPVFVITPDEWLKYNADPSKNGLPEFTLHFLSQGLKWKGTGKTGHVIETEPTIKPSKRLNW